MRSSWLALLAAAVAFLEVNASADEIKTPRLKETLRRPVALALVDHDRWLFVANRDGGSVSAIDTRGPLVVGEHPIGGQISDLAATADGAYLLAVDERNHRLVALRRQGAGLALAAEVEVARYPVSVCVQADSRRCFVASLWSRQLTVVDLNLTPGGKSQAATATVRKTLSLPFAPRRQLLVKDETRLIVADAFGGNLAVVDTSTGELLFVRELPAHNIRGLALVPGGEKLLVSHQIINDLAETTHNDVHWGVLMSNVLRWVKLDQLLTPGAQLLKDSHVHLAGDTNVAGGDPAAVAVTRDGQAILALAGVNEVAHGRERDFYLRRLPVGARPTAVVATEDGGRAYVANTFDDSVSIIDLKQQRVAGAIELGPRRALSLAERGETLFYDARLSLDGWFSCHSCHTDGHTNGALNDNLGDNSFGAAKRIPSLLGVGRTQPWAWNGQMTDLKSQIDKSIRTTMRGQPQNDETLDALAAYLKSLEPPPSLDTARGNADSPAVARGERIFKRENCAACHQPPEYTTAGVYDVGLKDKQGGHEFNPPSLRGVSQRGPYFHDNRAATLKAVFVEHRHQVGELSAVRLRDLLAFLRGL